MTPFDSMAALQAAIDPVMQLHSPRRLGHAEVRRGMLVGMQEAGDGPVSENWLVNKLTETGQVVLQRNGITRRMTKKQVDAGFAAVEGASAIVDNEHALLHAHAAKLIEALSVPQRLSQPASLGSAYQRLSHIQRWHQQALSAVRLFARQHPQVLALPQTQQAGIDLHATTSRAGHACEKTAS